MKKLSIIICSLFLMSFTPSKEMLGVDGGCNKLTQSYKSGEEFTLMVYYNWKRVWVKAGDCTFRVKDESLKGKPVLKISAIGRTYRSYDWVYKVRDKYETYLDKETLLPVQYYRDIYEGGYAFKYYYYYDRPSKR